MPADLHRLLGCFFAPIPTPLPLLLQLILVLLSWKIKVAVLLPFSLLASLPAIFSRPMPAIWRPLYVFLWLISFFLPSSTKSGLQMFNWLLCGVIIYPLFWPKNASSAPRSTFQLVVSGCIFFGNVFQALGSYHSLSRGRKTLDGSHGIFWRRFPCGA